MFSARNNISLKFTSPTKKLFAGFTLIEFIVAIMIIFLVFTVGMANMRGFQRRKVLDGAAARVVSHLRLAQQMSMSGTKPNACAIMTLTSINFQRHVNTGYRIRAICTSANPIIATYDLQTDFSGVTISNFSDVVFLPLGKGVENDITITLNQSSTGNSKIITIKTGGEININ